MYTSILKITGKPYGSLYHNKASASLNFKVVAGFCLKENLSTFSTFKQLLLFETVIPAEEKRLSATVDVAGMHNISLGSFIFHYSKIFVL